MSVVSLKYKLIDLTGRIISLCNISPLFPEFVVGSDNLGFFYIFFEF